LFVNDGSGRLEVTTSNEARIAGTFSFVLQPPERVTGEPAAAKVVTDGIFDVTR
jgi:hypothetical protein